MAPHKRTPATAMTGALENVACQLGSRDSNPPRPGQLIDKHGHHHTEAVLTAWSPQALKALGVRRVGDEPKGGVA